MDIKKLSVNDLKALLYDMYSEKERIEHNIKLLKEELDKKIEKEQEDKKWHLLIKFIGIVLVANLNL